MNKSCLRRWLGLKVLRSSYAGFEFFPLRDIGVRTPRKTYTFTEFHPFPNKNVLFSLKEIRRRLSTFGFFLQY